MESIRHYWRTHLSVVLGSALAALVLTGALTVGDSVKATLRAQADARVGKIGNALLCGERFVPWPGDTRERPPVVARDFTAGADAAGILMLSGTAAKADGSGRANKVQVVGVDDAFWKLSPAGKIPHPAPQSAAALPTVLLNGRLAAQLGVRPGGEILMRMEKPSAVSKDAPLSGEEDAGIAIRMTVGQIVDEGGFGRFSLTTGQVPPFTAFVPMTESQSGSQLAQR